MLIFYCDESGVYPKAGNIAPLLNQDEKDRWYFLAALAVSIEHRKQLRDVVLDVKNKYIVCHAPLGKLHERSPEAEIKGHELFAILKGGKPKFRLWNCLSKTDVETLLDELLSRLSFLHNRLYVVAIDQVFYYRKMFRLAWPSPFVALTFLQQKALYLLNTPTPNPDFGGRFGIFVVDRGSAVDQQFEVDEFLKTRDSISQIAGVSFPYDAMLLENPVVAKSSDVAQLQVCDLLLYIVADAIRSDNPQGEWFKRVMPFIAAKPDGKKTGAGLHFYPLEAVPASWKGF
ncbi:MAG: DUF3800 domain-containing protein [Dehalococcoidia bacterium]|nr:DUF3800 domain-containing protein [Dehalococcoidia bacterium]